jgi:hypothetical protein
MDTINYTDDDFLTDEEFFDALEDFRGPDITFTYTPEQDAAYERYLAKRQTKKQPKPRDIAEMKNEAYAKLVEFYSNEDNIVNERSPFDKE